MLKDAIKKAKGSEDKIGVSLKMPLSLKEKLQKTSDENNISLNALIVSILEMAYDEVPSSLLYRIEELGSKVKYYEDLIEKGLDSDEIGYNPQTAMALAKRELDNLYELANH